MGHIVHLRNSSNIIILNIISNTSVQSYEYTINIKRKNVILLFDWSFFSKNVSSLLPKMPLVKWHCTSFEQTWIPFTKGCFMQSLDEIGPVVQEKKIFKFCPYIFTILYYLLLERDVALHLNKLEFPSSKDTLCQVWLKLAQWFWRRRWKYKKVYGLMDERWSEKLTWTLRPDELKKWKINKIYMSIGILRLLISVGFFWVFWGFFLAKVFPLISFQHNTL